MPLLSASLRDGAPARLEGTLGACGPIRAAASARLDNRDELRTALGLPPDAPDADVIAHAYGRWGEGAARALEGDFAFVVWDPRAQRLYAARDRTGIRPLFYASGPGRLDAAGSLRAVLALRGGAPELEPEAFTAHLARARAPGATIWRGIERLPPGSWLSRDRHGLRVERYWTAAPRHPGCRTLPEWGEAAREILGRAVADRVRGAARAGVLVSGGLDSSALTVLAARHLGAGRLAGCASVPAGATPFPDERPLLDALERRCARLVIERLPPPCPDPFDRAVLEPQFERHRRPTNPFFYMDRALLGALAARGATVVLSGFWGDGTLSYRGDGWLAGLLARRSPGRALGIALALRRRGEPLAPLLRARALEATLRRVTATGFSAVEDGVVEAAGAGIDLAFPFLDRRVVELALAAPPELFVAGGRRRALLREAMQGLLPEAIRQRTTKTPFVPEHAAAMRRHWPSYVAFAAALRRRRGELDGFVDVDRLRAQILRFDPAAGPAHAFSRPILAASLGILAARFVLWWRDGVG